MSNNDRNNNNRRNVLVVGVDAEEFAQVAPFLEREAFDVDRFPSAAGALELVSRVPFEVLIVRYPPPDLEMYSFLETIRSEGNPCRASPLVLLTDADSSEEAGSYIGRGANRMVVLGESEAQIQSVVSGLLSVAPRRSARFFARLEIKLGGAKDMILCQTENISSTGMLIKTDRRYDVGTELHFEFSLPEDDQPIVGVAEIVRHTMIGRDPVGGIGLRFITFDGDSQRRFEAYCQQL